MVNDTVMMHKCFNGLSPSYLSNTFCARSSIAGFISLDVQDVV